MTKRNKAPDNLKIVSKADSKASDNFVRTYKCTMLHPAYMRLTYASREVYRALLIRCGENGRKTRCTFPQSEYKKYGFNTMTISRAVTELEQNGFIEVWRYHSKKPNEYVLVTRWKELKSI